MQLLTTAFGHTKLTDGVEFVRPAALGSAFHAIAAAPSRSRKPSHERRSSAPNPWLPIESILL